MACKSKEGSGSMPAPWSGLMSVLPPPGEKKRVTVDATTRVVVPASPAITVDITVKKAT
jgi:hypothetical protein